MTQASRGLQDVGPEQSNGEQPESAYGYAYVLVVFFTLSTLRNIVKSLAHLWFACDNAYKN